MVSPVYALSAVKRNPISLIAEAILRDAFGKKEFWRFLRLAEANREDVRYFDAGKFVGRYVVGIGYFDNIILKTWFGDGAVCKDPYQLKMRHSLFEELGDGVTDADTSDENLFTVSVSYDTGHGELTIGFNYDPEMGCLEIRFIGDEL